MTNWFWIWKQDLHGLFAVGDDVAYFVDAAHAARAEQGKDFIVADALAGFR